MHSVCNRYQILVIVTNFLVTPFSWPPKLLCHAGKNNAALFWGVRLLPISQTNMLLAAYIQRCIKMHGWIYCISENIYWWILCKGVSPQTINGICCSYDYFALRTFFTIRIGMVIYESVTQLFFVIIVIVIVSDFPVVSKPIFPVRIRDPPLFITHLLFERWVADPSFQQQDNFSKMNFQPSSSLEYVDYHRFLCIFPKIGCH